MTMRIRRAPRRPPCVWGACVWGAFKACYRCWLSLLRCLVVLQWRRRMWIARIVAMAAALVAGATHALSQSWPIRPMTLVVPFAAGGTSDVIARLLAEGLRAQLGQPVLVENVGGAGGMVGGSRVAKSPPDGYQMVLGNVGTHAQNQSLYKRPLYNVTSDFAPVALVTD